MAASTSTPHRVLVAVAVLLGGLAGCQQGTGTSGGCGPITEEALDPAYLVHTLDDAAPVHYTSDPPTSGPHKPSPPAQGVVADPISRPVQVGILERGDVLLQHDPTLPAADRRAIEALAADGVVVAPNPDLPAPIVATAWRAKRTCQRADVAALRTFITERAGKGPDG